MNGKVRMKTTHVTAVALSISLLAACHADNRKSRPPPLRWYIGLTTIAIWS